MSELPDYMLLGLIVLLTLLSAFFSSAETAMIGLNRYRLRHLVKQKHAGARVANRLLRRPDRLLGVILLGNNLVNFMAASLATVIGIHFFGDAGVVVAPVVLTVYFLIFAEVAPKTIAAKAPEPIAFTAAFVLEPLLRLFYPVVWFINTISNAVVKPFASRMDDQHQHDLSPEELRTVVNEGVRLHDQGQTMLLGVLDLEKVTVNDIMVPRSEIIGVDIDHDIGDIVYQLANSQHTRLPVYKENINNIIGILHLRRLGRFLPKSSATEPLTRADLLQLTEEPYYVPEGTPLHTQLINFKKERRRIALVVDEYGEVEGIVTMEDILEEIVGEFTTDFAASMPEIVLQEDGSYLIDGLAVLRDINRALGWELPTNGPKTLNGLVLEHLEAIPENNVCLKLDDYQIETLQIKDNVIKSLKLTRVA
ncbi:MAG TPA: HlyC/CorC family transporter [Pseudomonadales bacterium]